MEIQSKLLLFAGLYEVAELLDPVNRYEKLAGFKMLRVRAG
jgi:hypothetical protein